MSAIKSGSDIMKPQEIINASNHYNEIPFQCIIRAKSILDIGSSNGQMAKQSKYGFIFDKINNEGNYLGIDIQSFNYSCYNIIQKDLLSFIPKQKYALVIASHVLEHIDIKEWKKFFHIFFNCVSKKGYLIIITPFKQKITDMLHRPKPMQHKVFQIDKQLLEQHLSNGCYRYSKNLISRCIKEKHEFLPYTILRLFYRIITFHPYSIFKQNMYPEQIIGIWKKLS